MTDPARPLKADEVRRRCDPAALGFVATDELPPLTAMIGQERGTDALGLGINLARPGYNIFVAGPGGSGRTTLAASG